MTFDEPIALGVGFADGGVPPCLVLATDLFDRWLQQANLARFAAEEAGDDEIDRRFLQEDLPAPTLQALEVFLEAARYPLAVRSSSLLEDSQFRPLAGVYETVLLANDGDDLAARVRALSEAIRRVYASTFRDRARFVLAVVVADDRDDVALLHGKADVDDERCVLEQARGLDCSSHLHHPSLVACELR